MSSSNVSRRRSATRSPDQASTRPRVQPFDQLLNKGIEVATKIYEQSGLTNIAPALIAAILMVFTAVSGSCSSPSCSMPRSASRSLSRSGPSSSHSCCSSDTPFRRSLDASGRELRHSACACRRACRPDAHDGRAASSTSTATNATTEASLSSAPSRSAPSLALPPTSPCNSRRSPRGLRAAEQCSRHARPSTLRRPMSAHAANASAAARSGRTGHRSAQPPNRAAAHPPSSRSVERMTAAEPGSEQSAEAPQQTKGAKAVMDPIIVSRPAVARLRRLREPPGPRGAPSCDGYGRRP